MSKRDILQFEGCAEAWRRQALAQAGVTLADLSFVETHDCFTIAELIEYEAMGLCPRGRARAPSGRLDAEGRQAAGESLGRPQGQGSSDRRHRRLDARAHRDAALREAGDMQVRNAARRHLQHGRRDFADCLAAMALIGIGCAPVLMASLYVFGRVYAPERFAMLSSLMIGLGSLGNLLGATPLASAVQAFGWRGAMTSIAAVTAASVLIAFAA